MADKLDEQEYRKKALDVLVKVAESPSTPHDAKIRAADAILRHASAREADSEPEQSDA